MPRIAEFMALASQTRFHLGETLAAFLRDLQKRFNEGACVLGAGFQAAAPRGAHVALLLCLTLVPVSSCLRRVVRRHGRSCRLAEPGASEGGCRCRAAAAQPCWGDRRRDRSWGNIATGCLGWPQHDGLLSLPRKLSLR